MPERRHAGRPRAAASAEQASLFTFAQVGDVEVARIPEPATDPAPSVPAPPSGPKAEVPTREAGTPEAYVAWRRTPEGEAYWWCLVADALAALHAGKGRFSTRTHVAHYRDTNGVGINDHFTAWLGDDLVRAHQELTPIVERRVRRSAVSRLGPSAST